MRVALVRAKRQPEATAILGTYSEQARAIAIGSWRARALHEHRSAAVFSRLLPQLIAAEAGREYQVTVLRMAMDELHHASLCQEVVALLGGDPDVEGDLGTEALPEHVSTTRLEAALRNVVFVGCMSETVALAMLTEERELTREPAIEHVIAQLAADEMLHARLGWAFLAETWPRLDEAARARTCAYLPRALRYLEQKMLEVMPEAPSAQLPPVSVIDEARALGVLEPREARALLYQVIHGVVLPRLEDHGLPAADAWARRCELAEVGTGSETRADTSDSEV